jgi:hypothetical protein
LWSFGLFFPVLVCCTKINLATLDKHECAKPQDGCKKANELK